MKPIRALFLLIIPVAVAAHPGGGLIALDANTVIFGDSMYNAVWRLEKGKKAQALVTNFHAHWSTRLVARVDGKLIEPKIWNSTGAPRIWSIAIDERKRIYLALPDLGHVVRIDLDGSQHIVDRYVRDWRVTAVATFGDSVFLLSSSDSTNDGQRVRVIRDSGSVELLGQIDP